MSFEDHWLYRAFDTSGRLLYVGITTTGVKRFKAHGDRSSWWSEVDTIRVEHFPTREAVQNAEVKAIRREQPLHNTQWAGERSNVLEVWRRCRYCEEHFRPEPRWKSKTICPTCADEKRGAKGAS